MAVVDIEPMKAGKKLVKWMYWNESGAREAWQLSCEERAPTVTELCAKVIVELAEMNRDELVALCLGSKKVGKVQLSNKQIKEVSAWLTKLPMNASVVGPVLWSAGMKQSQKGKRFM